MNHKDYMRSAFDEAFVGMRNNDGGPFGAVIVYAGTIIAKAHNMVLSSNDPTAHAEIAAIREACKKQNSFHLNNAVLYATCEPCPMCLSAIYWAGIGEVYYCLDRNDAEKIGFSDKFIYEQLILPIKERSLKVEKIDFGQSRELFEEWVKKSNKTVY